MVSKKVLYCRRGIETVTSVFMLLLMFAVLTGLLVAFFNYNQSAQAQMQIEQERSQEQIMLVKQITESGIIKEIVIQNTGTIGVQIRALYKVISGETFFICDPSVDCHFIIDTHIAPGTNLTLNLGPLAIESNAIIVAATERGIKTINAMAPTVAPTTRPSPDTHKYTYGLLELRWEEFKYKKFDTNFASGGQWDPGWVVSSNSKYVAFKATVTNIGTKDIILDAPSSFTTIPSDTSDPRSWYLYSSPNGQQSLTLKVDVPTEVIFVWKSEGPTGYVSIYSQPTVAMVFLTFFGSFEGGAPYAQTVPFEAAITVV